MKDYDCFIYNNRLHHKDIGNKYIFEAYNSGKMPPFFRMWVIYGEYEFMTKDCIFANFNTLKNDYPEYFI